MTERIRIHSLYLFIFLSGIAGLGYEMVWTRMFSLALGHEIVAVLAVVAAFFSGLALGAYSLDGRVRRSRHPGRWYALLELIVGLWSLALILLIPAANALAPAFIGVEASNARQWLISFSLPFVLLLRVLERLRLDNLYARLGNYLAGSDELSDFAAGAPINRDDHPQVIFQAPGFAYSNPEPAYVRLLALVDRFRPDSRELLAAGATAEEAENRRKLERYWQVRNAFLHLGVGVSRAGNVRHMLAQVGEPLLDLVRLSPDFDAAYTPLLAMARQLQPVDAGKARTLLLKLEEANPQRPEAGRLLRRLFQRHEASRVQGSPL